MTKTKDLSKFKIVRYFKLKPLQKRDRNILDAYNMMEDVRHSIFYFSIFSYSQFIKELSLWHKLKCKPLESDVVNL